MRSRLAPLSSAEHPSDKKSTEDRGNPHTAQRVGRDGYRIKGAAITEKHVAKRLNSLPTEALTPAEQLTTGATLPIQSANTKDRRARLRIQELSA